MDIHSHPQDLALHQYDLTNAIPFADPIDHNGTKTLSIVLVTPSVRLLILRTAHTMKPYVVDFSKKLHLAGKEFEDDAKKAGLDLKLYHKGVKLPPEMYPIAARLHIIDMLTFSHQYNLATYTSINESGRENIFHRSF